MTNTARPGDQPRLLTRQSEHMTEMSDSEIEALNNRAFGTFMGFSDNPKADLVALLRSGAPISETVRDQLANAIEGESIGGVSLELRGYQAQQRRLAGFDDRKEWLAFGEKIFPFINGKRSIEAFDLASEEFGQSESYCKKCFYYFKNCRDWVESARNTGELYALMSDEQLHYIWNVYSINQKKEMKPVPPAGPEYDGIIRERLKFFRSITEGPEPWPESNAKMFIGAMLICSDLMVPE